MTYAIGSFSDSCIVWVSAIYISLTKFTFGIGKIFPDRLAMMEGMNRKSDACMVYMVPGLSRIWLIY